jgi:hypothetical protein
MGWPPWKKGYWNTATAVGEEFSFSSWGLLNFENVTFKVSSRIYFTKVHNLKLRIHSPSASLYLSLEYSSCGTFAAQSECSYQPLCQFPILCIPCSCIPCLSFLSPLCKFLAVIPIPHFALQCPLVLLAICFSLIVPRLMNITLTAWCRTSLRSDAKKT